MHTALVVGGGVAGLVAAGRLADAGLDVTLFERHAELGGRVRTVHRDGFAFDRGFQVVFTAYPHVRRELDYDALDLRRFTPGAVLCRPNHRSVLSDPFRDPRGAFETLANPDVTLGDKLRVLSLRRRLAREPTREILSGPDEAIAVYLDRLGFSRRFVERFVAPFYGGITLDRSLSTSRKVFDLTFKMLATGDVAVPAAGMGEIPDQLAARARAAGARVETDVHVDSVRSTADAAAVEVGGETVEADAVVVAADPRNARELTGVETIPTEARGCVTQYYALPAGYDLDAGGRLLLDAADDDGPNEVVPFSAVAPERAPEDVALVAATFLGVPDADDDALAERTRRALDSWYPERQVGSLDPLYTARVPFAQFAQPPGFLASLPDCRAPEGRCYLAGDYTVASSLDGAMESGATAARAVREDLA